MMIDHSLSDTDAWVLALAKADLPVLRYTARTLQELRSTGDRVNSRVLANAILHDPLLTLRVFAQQAERRRKSQLTDVTTIEQALMMMGLEPFFQTIEHLPLVEDSLGSQPRTLLGLLRVIERSRRAAHWARDWALYRHDLDAEEITIAALLHDISEILMWCFAPKLALRVEEMKAGNPQLRSATAQLEVYGTTLLDLQQALVHHWGLPQLLTTLMDESTSGNPRVRNVTLAVNLARHSANGWQDAAIPDDLKGLQELLHLSAEQLPKRLGVDAALIAPLTAPLNAPLSAPLLAHPPASN